LFDLRKEILTHQLGMLAQAAIAGLLLCVAHAQIFTAMTDTTVVLLSGARHVVQPPSYSTPYSSASNVSHVVAFDFQGMTIETNIEGATAVDVLLHWHRVNENDFKGSMPHRIAVTCTPAPLSGAGIAATASAAVSTVIDTNAQPKNATTPTRYEACANLSPTLRYAVQLFHITEANWNEFYPNPNWVEAVGFLFTSAPPNDVLVAPPRAALRTAAPRTVEFIGDSITAGFCNMCKAPPFPNATGYQIENFQLSWAHRTCAALGADCHIEAWSGYGMYENCCGGVTTMPDVFQRALGSDASSTWDLTKRTSTPTGQSAWVAPDAVVVNLGTNDYFDRHKNITTLPAVLTATYIKFLERIDKAYGSANGGRGPTTVRPHDHRLLRFRL
jgi:hypothetical protein